MGLGSSKTGQMTREELDLVQGSWKVVMEKPEEHGIFIFKRFLDRHDYYSRFKKFSGVPVNELPDNPVFRKHAASIIQALNNVILHLGNDSLLKSELHSLGKMHARRNVTEQQFQELKSVILGVLEQEFKLGDDSLAAWNKVLDIAFLYIFEGLRVGDQ